MRKLKWDTELEELARIAAHDICLKSVVTRACEATPNHLELIGSSELALSAKFKIEVVGRQIMEKW